MKTYNNVKYPSPYTHEFPHYSPSYWEITWRSIVYRFSKRALPSNHITEMISLRETEKKFKTFAQISNKSQNASIDNDVQNIRGIGRESPNQNHFRAVI